MAAPIAYPPDKTAGVESAYVGQAGLRQQNDTAFAGKVIPGGDTTGKKLYPNNQ